jgi:sugar lactone lactonase YvrE
MPVLSTLHVRVGVAAIIAAGMLFIFGSSSASAELIGEENNGPAGEYAGHCGGSKSDPVGIVFRGKASPINTRETIAERTGWTNTDTGLTVAGHRITSDKQELSVRQSNGKYSCEENQMAIAEAGGANSRTHVRLWRAFSQIGNLVTVATPHHEDFVVYSPTNNHCELIPGVLKIGNHAVDKGGVKQGIVSGFDRARHELNDSFSNAGYEVTSESWGNTQEFEQCDEDKAGSDGFGLNIKLVYAFNAHSHPATELLKSGARLNGELFTEEPQTEYWWGYGKQHAQGVGSYEHATVPKAVLGNQQMATGEPVTGLEPGATYYYRMFARNQEGVVREGPEIDFRTSPAIQTEDSDLPGPHTVVNMNGAVDSFFRTPTGGLGHAWTQGGVWSEQEVAGTAIAAGAVPHPVMSDKGLGHAWDDGSGWHTDTLSGSLVGEPHATVTASNGEINVLFQGTGGNLGRDYYVPGGAWTYDGNVPGSPRSDPLSVAGIGKTVDTFYRGAGGCLGHAWTQGGAWSAGEIAGTEVAAGAMPYPVVSASGRVDVFWRTPSNGLGHGWDDSNGWHFEVLPGTMVGEPTPAESPSGTIDVFYRTLVGELGHNWYQPGGQWFAGTIAASVGSDPHPVVQPDGQVDVFFQTKTGEVGHAWDDANGWHTEGFEVQASSIPLAAAQPNGTIDVLYRTLSGELGHSWYQRGGEWQSNTLAGSIVSVPPTASAESATAVTRTGAQLRGRVSPQGSAVSYRFEYGTTTSYGTQVPVGGENIGSWMFAVPVTRALSGLAPGTTYHWRLVAEGPAGATATAATSDQTFTTAPPEIVEGPNSSYSSAFGAAGTGNGQFNHPADVALDSKGHLWVVDKANNRIEEFSESGTFMRAAGSLGSSGGKLNSPSGIALDSTGVLDVSDTANNRVVRFNENGEFVSAVGANVNKTRVEKGGTLAEKNHCTAASGDVCQAGTPSSAEGFISEPIGIADGGSGKFFVVERVNNRVEKFNLNGEQEAKFSRLGSEEMIKEPTAMAVAPNGNLWVADTGRNEVAEWTPTYTFIRKFGVEGTGNGQFKHPIAIDFDAGGNLWVADENNRVQEFSETGEFLGRFGAPGTGTGQFSLSVPSGLAIQSSGNIWLTDPGSNRVEKWNLPS